MPTTGAHGTLTLKRGNSAWAANLDPAGGNWLHSRFSQKLLEGDTVSVRVRMGDGSMVAWQFSSRNLAKPTPH